jgi:hypothetical protein
VPKSGCRVTFFHRNRARTSADAAYSDEAIRRPGGMFQRGRRGEIERGSRGLYRRKRGKFLWSESLGIIAERNQRTW